MMRMSILEILIIIVSIVYIWQISGFIYDFTKFLYTKLNKGRKYMGQPLPKPFGCYTCIIFWSTTIYFYTTVNSNLILSIGVGVLSSVVGMVVDKLMMLIIRAINKIE